MYSLTLLFISKIEGVSVENLIQRYMYRQLFKKEMIPVIQIPYGLIMK